MNKQFEALKKSRELVLKKIDGLSLEQLHKIPDGFKNSIAWNVAHLVVTQQLLHYKLFPHLFPLKKSDKGALRNLIASAPALAASRIIFLAILKFPS